MHILHRRRLLATLLAAIVLGLAAHGANAQGARPLNLIVFGGGVNWPLWVAQDQKLFERNDLAVSVTTTPNSVFQITGMQDGKFDIAMTTFDNVVAYQEGQGEAALPRTPDFFAFMGGGIGGLRLLANPEIKSIAELKGKTLGVDAAATGYVLAMRKLLQQGGLGNDDYKFDRIGSTVARVEALQQNKVAATMVNAPSDLGPLARGYKPLADVGRDLGPYQQLSGMASRGWAQQNGPKLLSFVRSYKAAMDWLFDPQNKAAALAIYQKHLAGVTPAQAEGAYGSLLNGSDGLQREARLSLPGVRKVIELRAEYGEPKKPMGEASKYIDESYYNEALRGARAGG
jgi:ABC-type nitrate/sulfonate/bicarbonate transport system substrate-binding protein